MFNDFSEIRGYTHGKNVVIIYEPPPRKFYLYAIERLVNELLVEENSEIEIKILFGYNSHRNIVRSNQESVAIFHHKHLSATFSKRDNVKVTLVPLKSMRLKALKSALRFKQAGKCFPQLYGSTLSLAYSRQLIPEWMNSLPLRRLWHYRFKCSQEFFKVWQFLKCANIAERWDIVVFLNGRFPGQAAIRQYCENMKLPFLVLEQGTPKNKRLHIQPFQTQETIYSRNLLSRKLEVSSEGDFITMENWGGKWIESQATSFQNRFAIWDQGGESEISKVFHKASSKRAVCFNSSLEERFSNLGMEMNGWANQVEAFDQVIVQLKKLDYDIFFRIHPNYENKNLRSMFAIVVMLVRNRVSFAFPWEKVSTPNLILSADLVVTWGSTVALESTYRGIKTINLGRTSYDHLFDVRVFSANSGALEDILGQMLPPEKSKSAVCAFLVRNNGFELNAPEDAKDFIIKPNRSRWHLKFKSLTSVFLRNINSTPRDIFLSLHPIFTRKFLRLILGRTMVATAKVMVALDMGSVVKKRRKRMAKKKHKKLLKKTRIQRRNKK